MWHIHIILQLDLKEDIINIKLANGPPKVKCKSENKPFFSSKEKSRMKKLFERSHSWVDVTNDLWTSFQNLGYMHLAIHLIYKNWKLNKRIVNFSVLSTPHWGDNVAQVIETYLLKWGLKKLCTIAINSTSSNDIAMISLLKKFNRKGCF